MSEKDYEVGYCKPPKASRFKPGKSGNPKGRPKGHNNLRTDARAVLNESIAINEGGKRKKITAQKASLKRLRAKALTGDSRALERLILLAQQYNDDPIPEADRAMPKGDQAILEEYEKRLDRRRDAAADEPHVDTVDDDDDWLK